MAIVKSKHASNYTVIPNEVFNSGLSVEAIGLLAYFLSLPHDWVIYKTKLHEQLNLGREKLDRIFKELQEKGYVISVMKHDEQGRIEYEHIVYDKPFNGEPSTSNPPTALQSTANTQLLSTNKQSKQELKKHKLNIPTLEEFLEYAESKLVNDFNAYKKSLKLKYEAWAESGWQTGGANPKPIKNWKTTLLNTIPHLVRENIQQTSKPTYKKL